MTKKQLTLKVTKVAFYNGALVVPNEIIRDYKGSKIPSWATLLNGDEKTENNTDEKSQREITNQQPIDDDEVPKDLKENNNEQNPNEGEKEEPSNDGIAPEEKTETELMEEYNALLDEAVEKEILLEDADKKTVAEQIVELKKLLGKE